MDKQAVTLFLSKLERIRSSVAKLQAEKEILEKREQELVKAFGQNYTIEQLDVYLNQFEKEISNLVQTLKVPKEVLDVIGTTGATAE